MEAVPSNWRINRRRPHPVCCRGWEIGMNLGLRLITEEVDHRESRTVIGIELRQGTGMENATIMSLEVEIGTAEIDPGTKVVTLRTYHFQQQQLELGRILKTC